MGHATPTTALCQAPFDAAQSRAINAYVGALEPAIESPVVLPDLTMLEVALLHASRGFKVFPVAWIRDGGCSCRQGKDCPSPGKHPLHKGWQQEATSEPARVANLWASTPKANVGIYTQGLLVIDVDPAKGGAESLDQLEEEREPLDTLTGITGSGGLHLIYTLPDGVRCKNRVALLPGLDTRADGGFIVAPGSWHVSGDRYRWQSTYHAPSEAPAWLIDLCTPAEPARTIRAPRAATTCRLPDGLTGRLEAWAARGMWKEIQTVKLVGQGARFIELHKSAFRVGQLVGAGWVKESDAEYDLLAAGSAMGLSDHEALRAVSWGLRDGKQFPRKLPDWAEREKEKEEQRQAQPAGDPGRPATPRQTRAGQELSGQAAVVYDLLLDHGEACDPGGTPLCRLTTGELAQLLECTDRTVRGYLAELKDAGLIRRSQTRHGCETVVLVGAPPDEEPSEGDDEEGIGWAMTRPENDGDPYVFTAVPIEPDDMPFTFMSDPNPPDMLDSVNTCLLSELDLAYARDYFPTCPAPQPAPTPAPTPPATLPALYWRVLVGALSDRWDEAEADLAGLYALDPAAAVRARKDGAGVKASRPDVRQRWAAFWARQAVVQGHRLEARQLALLSDPTQRPALIAELAALEAGRARRAA